ncbi:MULTISPECIES: hypothetical protein [unclassified Streptomyces]|uniref:hypothetical protein n=1 Tax=unclassified Streptomyces TaxID=2593676 RepID=UPI002E1E1392|nr:MULTISPECIES: hypothetical protein [unclassified Streptomyces]
MWSYNQGLAIGGFTELWKATGDASLLATARTLADAAISNPALTRNGVLTESCDIGVQARAPTRPTGVPRPAPSERSPPPRAEDRFRRLRGQALWGEPPPARCGALLDVAQQRGDGR